MTKHFHEVMGETPFAYLTRGRMHLTAREVVRKRFFIVKIGAILAIKARRLSRARRVSRGLW